MFADRNLLSFGTDVLSSLTWILSQHVKLNKLRRRLNIQAITKNRDKHTGFPLIFLARVTLDLMLIVAVFDLEVIILKVGVRDHLVRIFVGAIKTLQ